MNRDDGMAVVVIDPASDPLRVARLRERAATRRVRKAAARLAAWTGQVHGEQRPDECGHTKEGR